MPGGDGGLGSQPGQRAMGSQLGLPEKSQREGGGILGSVLSILRSEPRGREREASPGRGSDGFHFSKEDQAEKQKMT